MRPPTRPVVRLLLCLCLAVVAVAIAWRRQAANRPHTTARAAAKPVATGQTGVVPVIVTVSDGTNTATSVFPLLVIPSASVVWGQHLSPPRHFGHASTLSNSICTTIWASLFDEITQVVIQRGDVSRLWCFRELEE